MLLNGEQHSTALPSHLRRRRTQTQHTRLHIRLPHEDDNQAKHQRVIASSFPTATGNKDCMRARASPSSSNSRELRYSTNSQTGIVCHEDRLQSAFKVLMIHRILRFTLVIAICCVLHRCKSQDIHCQKLSDKFISYP